MDVHLVAGGGFDCNQFLVTTSQQALLVDAGTGLAADSALATIEETLGDRELDRIYLTHWHHDHVGGAPRMAKALDAELVMPEAEAAAVREGRADLTLGDKFGAQQTAHPVTGIEPGARIDLGDISFDLLHTPGHTAGHTSLWHEESGTLIAGDAVFANGAFGRVDLPTGDPATMLDTLEELAGMPIESLYPGHTDVVETGAKKHVEMALSNARGML